MIDKEFLEVNNEINQCIDLAMLEYPDIKHLLIIQKRFISGWVLNQFHNRRDMPRISKYKEKPSFKLFFIYNCCMDISP